ncbi:ketosteroid isomerase family protein [Kitasatospora sp. NPDC091335]|uniref:ketosteroid isomerase family protein n=1 Tax=Kitasatospora sp. NPDC091335 TaxID=3364085 RepID=UPI003809927A
MGRRSATSATSPRTRPASPSGSSRKSDAHRAQPPAPPPPFPGTAGPRRLPQHRVTVVDSQPTAGGGVLVVVTGSLAVDNAFDKPLQFTGAFNLQPIPGQPGGFFVHNHVFRLILA